MDMSAYHLEHGAFYTAEYKILNAKDTESEMMIEHREGAF